MYNSLKESKVHFIGIGGIGMSGIAEVLLSLGYKVTGSDVGKNANVEKLIQLGATIFIGHKAENIQDQTIVVYSSAIKEDNLEMIQAKVKNIPIMKRAEMLSELMRQKIGLAVAGTHGKTTTTSLLATIFEESNLNPSYIIGGIVSNLKGHARYNKSEVLIAESDESDGSFLLLSPIISVITNVDTDHLDYYGTKEKLLDSFISFANKVPFYGACALNLHDSSTSEIIENMRKPWLSFGVIDELTVEPTYGAKKIEFLAGQTKFELYYKGEFVSNIMTTMSGKHNVLNSLAAISIAHFYGISFDKIKDAICKFSGVGRRLEKIYQNDFIEIIDDYGHHPTEIRAVISAIKSTSNKKLIVLFEPHRYSRTRDCWADFLHCFNGADEVYLFPIYAASESIIDGITHENLAIDINKIHPKLVTTIPMLEDAQKILMEVKNKKMPVIVVSLGAGAIGKKIREIVKNVFN